MLQKPRVSIIIPVYNGSNFLAEAIESCLAQTYSNIEILIVDDGSNDNGETKNIIDSFGSKVRSISKKNGGVASALNVGIAHMTGDYASWLSHDDLYYPEKIEKQINFLNTLENHKSIVYSNYAIFTNNHSKSLPMIMEPVDPRNFRYWLTIKDHVHGCTLLIPRQAFEEAGLFDESLKITQDYDLWFRMAKTYQFVQLPDVLVKARSHKDQDTHKKTGLVRPECNAILVKFIQQLSKDEICQATKKTLDVSYNEIASCMWARGYEEAEKAARELANLHSTSNEEYLKIRDLNLMRGRAKVMAKKYLSTNLIFTIKRLFSKEYISMPKSLSLRDKFSEVYHKNLFEGEDSRSGAGSDLIQTEIIRREIPKIVEKYKVKTFLDAPCGDWYWMSHTNLGVKQYIGVDIVEDMIKINQKKYGNDSVNFQTVNLTEGPIPPADLIFSRDCLVHLSFEDAFAILENFKKSGAKYLLTTTFTNRDKNQDLIDEQGNHLFWRTLNMEISPFNFPKPLELINEGCMEDNGNYKDKCLGLWLLEDLPLSKG